MCGGGGGPDKRSRSSPGRYGGTLQQCATYSNAAAGSGRFLATAAGNVLN